MSKLKIENFSLTSLSNPQFAQPVRINYTQNNMDKTWEAVKAHDSVAVLLYHEEKNSFILVKQFRAPVYMHHNEYSYTYELCAGIVDKSVSLKQIAKEEIEEECGFNVEVANIEKITSFFTNVGISGAKQHLYFATVDEHLKVHEGGGIHTEEIEVVYLSLEDAKKFIYDESKAKTPGLMFAFYWFFEKFKIEVK